MRIGPVFIVTQLLVIGIIVVFNAAVCIFILRRLSRRPPSSKRPDTKLTQVRRAFSITVLFGLTWVFGLLSIIHEDASLYLQILSCFFNSFQGVFIFVMFCLLPDEVQNVWKAWIPFVNMQKSNSVQTETEETDIKDGV